jgi:hypothetical protein
VSDFCSKISFTTFYRSEICNDNHHQVVCITAVVIAVTVAVAAGIVVIAIAVIAVAADHSSTS